MITKEVGNTTFDLQEYIEVYRVGDALIKSDVKDRVPYVQAYWVFFPPVVVFFKCHINISMHTVFSYLLIPSGSLLCSILCHQVTAYSQTQTL